jgi:DNA-binding transcriptional LysR family regulator
MRRPTLVELEAVSAVARAGGFRGAGKELGLSASALSHAVSSLERRLGVRLFQRSTRSVTLTEEGETLVGRLQPMLRELESALDDVQQTGSQPRGTLRLVAPRGPAELTLMPLVLALRQRHPGVRVELVSDARLVDIVAEGFDAGLRYAGSVPRDMVAVPCGPDLRIAVVATRRYFARHPAPDHPRELAGHDCIRYRKESGIVRRWPFRVQGREVAFEVDGSLVVDDEAFLLRAALDGAGLSYLSEAAAAPHLAAGRLVRVLERFSPRFEAMQLFYPGGQRVRAPLQAFVALVRERRAQKSPAVT